MVTLLRLLGEVRRWSPEYFNRLPGGGLSPLGITWLVPLVGFYFGWRLQRKGVRPSSPLQAALQPAVAVVAAPAIAMLFVKMRASAHLVALSWTAGFVLWAVVSVLAVAVALAAWPALGRLLLGYALLARLPVAAVMALAIRRGWGTHYDLPPPGFPPMPPLQRWLWIGLLPQTTIWVAFTVGLGAVFGALGWLAASRLFRGRLPGGPVWS